MTQLKQTFLLSEAEYISCVNESHFSSLVNDFLKDISDYHKKNLLLHSADIGKRVIWSILEANQVLSIHYYLDIFYSIYDKQYRKDRI